MLISQPNEKHHLPFYPNWYLPIIPTEKILTIKIHFTKIFSPLDVQYLTFIITLLIIIIIIIMILII